MHLTLLVIDRLYTLVVIALAPSLPLIQSCAGLPKCRGVTLLLEIKSIVGIAGQQVWRLGLLRTAAIAQGGGSGKLQILRVVLDVRVDQLFHSENYTADLYSLTASQREFIDGLGVTRAARFHVPDYEPETVQVFSFLAGCGGYPCELLLELAFGGDV